jgi:hypothetical protein
MGVPTTTTAPQNVYQLYDDSGTTAGPTASGPTGGTSGYLLQEFTAPSLTAATTVAYLYSSLFQRPVRLANKYVSAPPWTLVVGAGPNTVLTVVPSGIGY